jgi:hypothetical protein
MTDPSNTVAPEVYLQAAAAANNFESFGRSIASSILQASADPASSIDVSASAEPVGATHGTTICTRISVNINGVGHQVIVCVSV